MIKEPFIKCCSECLHWSYESMDWGSCDAEIPANVIPISIYQIEKGMTKRTDGGLCPCFKDRVCEY